MSDRLNELVRGSMAAWKPPPRLNLSEWADQYFYLSAESSAEPGRWRTLPYQRGILDAITDPAVTFVTVMKSARVGYTKMIGAAIGYFIHQDPCPIMVVQPTVEDAEGYSKEEIAPMIRDCPVLTALVGEAKAKDGGNTILQKIFPGGSLSMVGANSGRGFRRVSRKVVIFDEIDGYPPSAGTEGDQIKLGIRRTEFYWDRKIIDGSTPLLAGASRVEDRFHQGDRRRFYVPCPQCGHMDFLTFREENEAGGHWMSWPKDEPKKAHFVCRKGGCVIEHKEKRAMVAAGEWRAEGPFTGHASFHVWAAYSFSPNATWAQIAEEFIDANNGGVEKLKTFVNTVLGETWTEKGEAPDWQRLYQRREIYEIATVPEGVRFLTAGVDVQKDRLIWEVVGWGDDRQSWSIDAGVIAGDTSDEAVWTKLDELLGSAWPGPNGSQFGILVMAVDSGFNTQQVYSWARRHPGSRVMATKGVATAKTLTGPPTPVDVTVRGKRIARGAKVWPIGINVAKAEFYGWLRLETPTKESGAPFPPGYCHFPEHGEAYFQQITAEQLVASVKRGFKVFEWHVIPGRENHWLDCRVMARAAAAQAGLDRLAASRRIRKTPRAPAPTAPTTPAAQTAKPEYRAPPEPPRTPRGGGGFLGDRGRGSWLKRR